VNGERDREQGTGSAVEPSAGFQPRSPLTADRSPVLVIQTAFLGDVILTTPLLASLARRHGPVDIVTTPQAAPLVEHHPAVREVIRYDKRDADRGVRGFFRLVRKLRERRYDRVYLPHRSWRSGSAAWLARIRERIGFADGASMFYTSLVPRPEMGHEVERLLALAGTPETEPPVEIGLTEDAKNRAGAWLEARGLGSGFIALAPGSIWGTKRWPYYAELAARLDGPVIVVGGREDEALGEEIAAKGGDKVHNAAGLSLLESAALIQRARLLVTNDSAPLHLATAAGTPIVAIFGPTVPSFGFGPRGPQDRIVEHDHLACRPCSAHGPEVCPLGHHRCMKELPVEEVLAAVAHLEERRPV
jgi:heptosyltransferase II